MGRHAADDAAGAGVAAGAVDAAAGSVDVAAGSVDLAAVRVVAGHPTPEELAAVIAVLQRQADEATALGRSAVTSSPRSDWDVAARGLRTPIEHGPGAWGRALR